MSLYANNTKITSAHANNISAIRVFADGVLVHREGYEIKTVAYTGKMGSYVDTGVVATANTKWSLKAYFDNVMYNGFCLAEYAGAMIIGRASNNNVYAGYDDRYLTYLGVYNDGIHTYTIANGSQQVDGVVKGTKTWTASKTPKTITLGGLHTNYNSGGVTDSSIELTGDIRIYRCQIWEGGTLIRDLYPARRNSDTHAGMYDVVYDVFYDSTNSSGSMWVLG